MTPRKPHLNSLRLTPPEFTCDHEWLDITTNGALTRHEMCRNCPKQRFTEFDQKPIEAMKRLYDSVSA